MIKSLNKAYENKDIIYMCNTLGEINDPDSEYDRMCEPEDVMTPEELELYNNYWSANHWADEYVLRMGDNAAIGINFLIDVGWCRDVTGNAIGKYVSDEEAKNKWMPKILEATKKAATDFIQPALPNLDIYVGDWTDVDGHELMVVVPYEERENLEDVARFLDVLAFKYVEETFKKIII